MLGTALYSHRMSSKSIKWYSLNETSSVPKVLVCHHSLNSAGGGERVALHLIRLLQEMEFEVYLATSEPTDWEYVRKVIGIELLYKPREYTLLPFRLRAFGIYQRAFMSLYVARYRRKFDLVINTHGDVMVVPSDITYLHFPILAYMYLGYLKPYFKYLKSPSWFLYFTPYYMMQKALAEPCYENSLLITNSRFSAATIRKLFGLKSVVVYPPVEVEQYLKLSEFTDREDAVVYIARFSEEKNNHLLIHVARELPDVKFYLVGTAYGKGRYHYEYCRKLRERLNVKNIEILANVPHDDKLRILKKCKVYVHLFPTEHFGISVVEAMASGLVPVVHKSGGVWTDVVEYGRYGIGYERLDPVEIAAGVEAALRMWGRAYVNAVRTHVLKFSVESFRVRIRRILELYLSKLRVG